MEWSIGIPPLFFTNMACLALTKNHKRCRSYASLEKDANGSIVRGFTCAKHATYFSEPNLSRVKRLLLGNYTTRGYSVHLEFRDSIREWVRDILIHGLITITKEDIQKIDEKWTHGTNHFYFIYLCALYLPTFDPFWGMMLWVRTMQCIWDWSSMIGPITITWSDIQDVICDDRDIVKFYSGIMAYTSEHGYMDRVAWFRFFEKSASRHPSWIVSVFSICDTVTQTMCEKFSSQFTISESLKEIFSDGSYMAWLAAKRSEFYREKQERCSLYKNELLMVAWNPDRYKTWCIDTEDLQGLDERWNYSVTSYRAPDQVVVV